jgi:acetolactate synthase-1/2/3 large subunit
MMQMRVSDWIARYLEGLGVRKVFLVSGGGMMHLLDSISRTPGVGYVCNHHEQACAMGAQAYARQTGSLGVCYATSGPGGTNTVTGILEAWQDSSPLLVVTGQSKVSQTIRGSGIEGLRQFGTFEVDIVPIVAPVTKFAAFLDDPRRVRACFEEAVYHATTGRPGPVLIDIPLDVQGAPIDPAELEGFTPPPGEDLPRASPGEVHAVAERLAAAGRPLVLAGHGVRTGGAADDFLALVERLNVPVVTTALAKDLLPYDHPLFVGHPGVKGDRAGNLAVQNADLIVSLGCSLHVTTTGYELDQFAVGAHKVQVDIDPAVLRREGVGVQQKILSDVSAFVGALSAATAARHPWVRGGEWHTRCAGWKERYAVIREPRPEAVGGVDYYAFVHALSDAARGGETLVTDAGSAYYVVGQAFRARAGQRVIVSGALGTMGYALPAALGVASADPDRTVLCVTGDGSLQTNLQELATLSHYGFNVKLLVVSNGGYVSIRNTQNSFFSGNLAGASLESGVWCPPLEGIAEAFSIPYLACREPRALADSLRAALDTPGPVVCEIFGTPEQVILPSVTSVRLASGAMQSKPLHDMAPFLPEGEVAANMYAGLERTSDMLLEDAKQ